VQYSVNAAGNHLTYTDTLSKVTSFEYDLPGRITRFFQPSTPTIATATNTYDTLGRIKTQTDAAGNLYNYYFAGTRSEEVTPTGTSLINYFDDLGKTIRATDRGGRLVLNSYDGYSRLANTSMTTPRQLHRRRDLCQPTALQHNIATEALRPKTVDRAPLVRSYTYDASYNRVQCHGRAGRRPNYTYEAGSGCHDDPGPADGRIAAADFTPAYACELAACRAYYATGATSFRLFPTPTPKIDATNSVITAYTYNAANAYAPASTTVDSGGLALVTTTTYDAVGNLTLSNGPRSDVTDTTGYAYDSERRVLSTTDALGKIVYTAYDADGRVVRTSSQIGTGFLATCTTYTNTGKQLRIWGPGIVTTNVLCPTAAAPVAVSDFTYDALERSRLVTATSPAEGGNRVTEYSYGTDDQITLERRGVGSAVVQDYRTLVYGSTGQVYTIKDAAGNLTTHEYDGFDRLAKLSYPSKTVVGTSSTTDYEAYTYDANSNRSSLRRRDGQLMTMSYDALNRLTLRTYPLAADNVSYSYDLLGHTLRAARANAADEVTYVYDKAGRVTRTTAGTNILDYAYDAAGNRTELRWDPRPTAIVRNTQMRSTAAATRKVPTVGVQVSTATIAAGYDDRDAPR
jgi:YD repeat-containing protein